MVTIHLTTGNKLTLDADGSKEFMSKVDAFSTIAVLNLSNKYIVPMTSVSYIEVTEVGGDA